MHATDTLRAEHDAILVVLDQLQRAADAAAHGVPVPADVFTDIQEFFAVFVDRCHHGKEEAAVFSQLGGEPGSRLLVERLTGEHAEGRQLAQALREAVEAYVPGDAASGQRIVDAADEYGAMLRVHIWDEDGELFPVMEQRLGASDREIERAFDRIEEEEIGPGTHERLHGMIDSLPGRIAPWVVTV